MNFLLLFRAAELIGYKENILLIVNKYKCLISDTTLKNVFYYYQRKYNGANESELEDLICEYLPSSCLDIFSNEINSFVSKTKHYSSLYKFLNN